MPIIQAGTTNLTSSIVPDLYVVIVPPSTLLLNGVPSNSVGLVGTASWGPVNIPVSVDSMANFSAAFGQINNRKYDMGTHAAIIVQQGGNSIYGVRVTDGSEAKASVALGSTNITFNALYAGTFGNSITVTIQNGAKANTIAAVVSAPGYAAEIFNNIPSPPTVTATVNGAVTSSTNIVVNSTAGITSGMTVTGTGITGSPTVTSVTDSTHLVLSVAQTLSDQDVLTFAPTSYNGTWVALANAINNGQNALRGASKFVTATAGSGMTAPVNATSTLSGGSDGVTSVTAATLVGDSASNSGMYALAGTNVAMLDLADVDDSTQWTTIDEFAVAESCYAIQTLPAGTTVTDAVTSKRSSGLDSPYSKLMHGDWLWWNDPVNGVVRLVSPQAFAAGRLSNLTPQLTTLNKTLYGVAGSQKSGVAGANNAFYSTADLSTLFQAGIDVITNPGAGGLAIWTCRSGHNSSSDISRHMDSYPTLTNYIAKTLAAGMGLYIGREITKGLFDDISATLNQFMANLAGAGLLASTDGSIPYNVQCNNNNNPSSQTKLGIVTATVQALYPSINETFIVNLQGGSTITVTQATNLVNNQ